MKRTNKFTYTITAVIAIICFLLTSFMSVGAGARANAAIGEYSNVLDDLWTDESFDASEYPSGGKDYSIDIIQVAESTEGQLLVYTYQPYGKIYASSVSISKTIGETYSPLKYELTFLNSFGVFYKYLVKDFTLSNAVERYYNISQIWRKYDKQIDGGDLTPTLNEVGYNVGKYWTATTGVDGNVTYSKIETEVVEIVNPYPFSVRYPNGTNWTTTNHCDAHYISFDVGNYDIDRLLSADVTYKTRPYSKTALSGMKEGALSEPRYMTVNHDDEPVSNTVNGLFGVKYTWDRINRTEDLIKQVNLQDEELVNKLKERTWVIGFCETDYTAPWGMDDTVSLLFAPVGGWAYALIDSLFSETSGTVVEEVAVLRLEFEVDGKAYNLGTVTNIVTGPQNPAETKPDAVQDFWKKLWESIKSTPWWVWVIVAVVLLLVIVIVIEILKIFFPAFGVVLSAIWKAITAPFRWIGNAVKRGRERREQKRAEKEAAEQRRAEAERRKKKQAPKKKKKAKAKK